MEFLFDSRGHHIANLVNGQLHAPTGENIGHFMKDTGIFIDMQGGYLGQIVMKNRLMYQQNSPYRSTSYGSYGNHGNVGNYSNPGNYGSVGMISGFDEVETPWLR